MDSVHLEAEIRTKHWWQVSKAVQRKVEFSMEMPDKEEKNPEESSLRGQTKKGNEKHTEGETLRRLAKKVKQV